MGITVLVVIDIQNDYFPGGKFPLWNADAILQNILAVIENAKERSMPVVLIKHAGNPNGAFLAEGSSGADIHPAILAAAPDAPVVVKRFADGFDATDLKTVLDKLGAERLLFCGMMTQNCVTHTAISPQAVSYEVGVVGDCCTTVSEVIHKVALNAVSRRLKLLSAAETFKIDPSRLQS